MESTKPRSVLAAFQERLQLASSKCGSLMEQLNIVRKKVEGEEALMGVEESVSNNYLDNVNKEIPLHSKEPDCVDSKDVQNIKQMDVENDVINEQSNAQLESTLNGSDIKAKVSRHSLNEKVVCLSGETKTSVELESYSVETDTHRKEIIINEQISGKSDINTSLDRDLKSLSQEISSDDDDDDSTLSSCSSSNGACQEASGKQNLYEELLKRLKENEEKKMSQKSRSSSENSSSTIPMSFKTDKSSKINFSDCTLNEDKFDKKNGEIDNLNTTGIDFFLPSSVTEKFQEIFYEESDEECQDSNSKYKHNRVTFDNINLGKYKKDDLGDEKLTENNKINMAYLQNKILNEKNLKMEDSPLPLTKQNKNDKKSSNLQKKSKVKDTFFDIMSVQTSETRSKKTSNKSLAMNVNLHTPELTLYRKLNTTSKLEMKKNCGKKDLKTKKPLIINTKLKSKNVVTKPNLKNINEKKMSETIITAKQISEETKVTSGISKRDGGAGKKTTQSLDIAAKPKIHGVIPDKNFRLPENKVIVDHKQSKNINNEPKSIKKEDISRKVDSVRIDDMLRNMEHKKNDTYKAIKQGSKKNASQVENLINSQEKRLQINKNQTIKKEQQEPLSTIVSKTERVSKIPVSGNQHIKTISKELLTKRNSTLDDVPLTQVKLKNKNDSLLSSSNQLAHVKKELQKIKTISDKKEDSTMLDKNEKLDNKTLPFNNIIKAKDQTENLRKKQTLSKETIYSQNISGMKTLTTTFPFILGQSTSKTYNVRAAIQQTMSMIVKSPAETLRRSSFSEMLNVSSRGSTQKSCSSYNSGRKLCPACVIRGDEEEDMEETPIDPWDTEYHSKRFIRCTCMPRNTVNFKTVMNQILLETSSSYLPSESYQESELENGEDTRINNSFLRRNNNIYKLSKLLHRLLRIRDLLIT